MSKIDASRPVRDADVHMSNFPRHRTVADVMTRRVHVASPVTPFKFLVRLIEDNRISAVPIVDQQGTPIGIVSESDLLLKERRHELESAQDLLHPRKRRQERLKAEAVVASEVMTTPPVTIGLDSSLAHAARLMYERKIRRLVVTDERGKIAGIVSRGDLLQVFLRSDEDLRDEVAGHLIPAVLLTPHEELTVEVRWNVVTISGQVDRKSDAEILVRMTGELDGVVDVVNRLSYRWDDTVAAPGLSVPFGPGFGGI